MDICLGTDCVQLLFMFLPFGVAGGFWGPGRTARRAGARNGAFTARPGGQNSYMRRARAELRRDGVEVDRQVARARGRCFRRAERRSLKT